MNQYKVARGVIKLPRDPKSERKFNTAGDFISQGQLVPPGILSDAAVQSLLAEGRIELLGAVSPQQVASMPKRKGKWSVDPIALVGKTYEDLLIMVLEIDPKFDVSALQNPTDAVRQLTQDWDPAFREQIAESSDRSRPERLRTSGTKDLGERPLSEAAERSLANAKERAQAQAVVIDPKQS